MARHSMFTNQACHQTLYNLIQSAMWMCFMTSDCNFTRISSQSMIIRPHSLTRKAFYSSFQTTENAAALMFIVIKRKHGAFCI